MRFTGFFPVNLTKQIIIAYNLSFKFEEHESDSATFLLTIFTLISRFRRFLLLVLVFVDIG